jgi:hypothetical protein
MKRVNHFKPKTRNTTLYAVISGGEFNGPVSREYDWRWARAQVRRGRIKRSEFVEALATCGSFWKLRAALDRQFVGKAGMQ